MQEIIFNGEKYFFNNGRLYDESFLEVPTAVSETILAQYFNNIDYTQMEEKEFVEHLKNLKRANANNKCLKVIEYGLGKFSASTDYYKTVFPIITSCYRNIGKPEKAIAFWMENKEIFKNCLSVPLLTSLAAAYCDVGQYEIALKCAQKAYAMQGGSKNYATELSNVFHRINKVLGNKDY